MKNLLILVFCISQLAAMANPVTDSTANDLRIARVYVNSKSRLYNPQKAFTIYSKYASKGNSEALNGLAMLYNLGLGVSENETTALDLFKKSAQKGYARAWYNLGLMDKTGIGTDQDLTKAYNCFKKGAALNDGHSIYGQGFMLYKGLGCTQNYDMAFKLFAKGSAKKDLGAMYMFGLCYRNGYGITANIDSARYWLTIASSRGYSRATDELASATPENIDLVNLPDIQPHSTGSASVNLKTGFTKVSHHLPVADLSGEYVGYAIKFDWSGKHVIGQSSLKLKLKAKGTELNGNWTEDDTITTHITAQLGDSAIVFNNTSYSHVDHYDTKTPNNFEFKMAQMHLVKNADTVFITGNLQLYSTKLKEPEKPIFVMLIRNSSKQDTVNNEQSRLNNLSANNAKTDSLHFLAYPNPFVGTVNLRFTLKKAANVSIIVSNLINGTIVYRSTPEEMEAGDHTSPVIFNGLPGNYVVTLRYGNKIKSAIVFKQ